MQDIKVGDTIGSGYIYGKVTQIVGNTLTILGSNGRRYYVLRKLAWKIYG